MTSTPIIVSGKTTLHTATIWACALCLFAISAYLVRLCFQNYKTIRQPLSKLGSNTIILMASSVGGSPLVKFLLVFGLAFTPPLLACELLGWRDGALTFTVLSATPLLIGGTMDVFQILARIWRSVWAPIAGKVLSVTLGVVLGYATFALAKQSVHTLTGIDPKYLSDFVGMLTAALLPITYALAAATILLILALLQYLNLAFILGLAGTLKRIAHWSPQRLRGKLLSMRLHWRLEASPRPRKGKGPGIGYDGAAMVARPFATITVATALAMGSASLLGFWPTYRWLFVRALVAVEYRQHTLCPNAASEKVAYMENDRISVALPTAQGYRFEVRACGWKN